MAPPPPSSPHSTVTPLSLSHCAARRDLCGLPRRLSLISSSCCPLGSLLDHALLSAAQQSSPHSLPLPTPPSSRRALTHSRPLLTHTDLVYPLRTAPTHISITFPLRPSQHSRRSPPPLSPPSLRRPPHERRQGRPSGLEAREEGRKAVRACVSSVAGPRSKERGDEGSR